MNVVLSEHLPLLALAPGGIQRLRGLIVELAVRGMLVPQDPNDEPAIELLKQIATERKRLEAEGICKKSKPMSLVGEKEQPFDGPDIWEFVHLGSVLEMVNGRAFKPGDWRPAGIPIVRIQNLNNPTAPYNYCDADTLDDRHRLVSGDFLISWSGTPGTSFGAFIWNRGEAALNQHIFRCIQIGAGFTSEFLRLAINSQLNVLIAKAQGGVGLQHVTKGTLEALVLPLPPLAEQDRIVAKVDELMALCDRLEAEQADATSAHARLVESLLGTLTQSTDVADLAANWQRLAEHFDNLFTTEARIDALKQTVLKLAVMGKLVPQDPNDEPASELVKRIVAGEKSKKTKSFLPVGKDDQPFTLPDSWQWVRFGMITENRLGKMLDAAKNRGDLKPYLRNTNVQWWQFELDDIKEMRLAEDELAEFRLMNGDLLICEGGEPGRCAIWRADIDEMYFQKALHRARPLGGCISEFLQIVLRQDAVSGALNAYFTGATIKHFPGDKLNSYAIPLPPVAEQRRIVAKVDELMMLCDDLQANIAAASQHQATLASTLIESALEAA